MKPIAVLMILTVAACLLAAPGACAQATDTGEIEGQIVLSPASPVSVARELNQRPMQGKVTAIDNQSRIVARAETDQNGNFRIALVPGSYTLHLEPPNRFGHAKDSQVIVNAGTVTKTLISFDSGIR